MKKRLSILFLLGVFLLLFTGQAWAGTIDIQASDDREINRKNQEFKGHSTSEQYNVSGDIRIYIKFPLSSLNGTIVKSATLRVYKTDGYNRDVYLGYITSGDWTEQSNGPVPQEFTNITSFYASGENIAYYLNTTNIVKNWVSGSIPNYGFVLYDLPIWANTTAFASRHNTDPTKVPLLTINYIAVPSNISFSNVTSNSMTISWTGTPEYPDTVYELYRNDVLIYSGAATSFIDTGLSPATTYTYKVRAKSGTDYTSFSTPASKLTLPATPATPTATVFGLSWSNDANNPGRGKVVLSWPAVAGASKYGIYFFDGNTYWKVDETAATSWDSSARKIFPSEATLNALGDNTVNTNLFVAPTTGQDIPDRPGKLYRKTIGTTYDTAENYWVSITAINATGETPRSTPVQFTLPDRTDTVAPTGSIKINDGSTKVTSIDVTLNISASDDKSGLYQVQFSNDNVSWSPWEAYTTSKEWQIGAGIGQQQTVYMKLKDQAGNVSNIISVSVFFASDATPPVIKVSINNGAKQTDSRYVTLYIEASDDFSTVDQITVRVSANGKDWHYYSGSGWVSGGWGPYKYINEDFDLGTSGGNKPIFVQAKDAAGNIANATTSIFYVTPDTLPGSNMIAPTANATWGINHNGKYVSINGEVMQVIQGNSVSVAITGLSNATELITSFDGITWSQPDRIPAGVLSITKDVTWPDEGKKTLYLKVRNDAGVESPIIIRRYLVDYTAPVIEVRTASGATMTSGSNIDLIVKARDNVSTALAYRINGGEWNTLPSNGIISAPVAGGQGLKRITIEVVDEAGNVTQEVVNIWKA